MKVKNVSHFSKKLRFSQQQESSVNASIGETVFHSELTAGTFVYGESFLLRDRDETTADRKVKEEKRDDAVFHRNIVLVIVI